MRLRASGLTTDSLHVAISLIIILLMVLQCSCSNLLPSIKHTRLQGKFSFSRSNQEFRTLFLLGEGVKPMCVHYSCNSSELAYGGRPVSGEVAMGWASIRYRRPC